MNNQHERIKYFETIKRKKGISRKIKFTLIYLLYLPVFAVNRTVNNFNSVNHKVKPIDVIVNAVIIGYFVSGIIIIALLVRKKFVMLEQDSANSNSSVNIEDYHFYTEETETTEEVEVSIDSEVIETVTSPEAVIEVVDIPLESEFTTPVSECILYEEAVFVNALNDKDTEYFRTEFNIMYPSYLSEEEINTFLEGTNLEGLGKYYLEAEAETGINAAYICAVSCLESGYGSSKLAKTKHNIFGWGANDDNPMGSAYSYDSYSDCIIRVMKTFGNSYCDPDGKYFEGTINDDGTINLTIEEVNEHYCSQESWEKKVASIMIKIFQCKAE